MTDQDPREAVETLRDRIEEGEREVNEADREVLLTASDNIFLVPSEIGDHRHLKILRHATRMAEEVGGLADAIEDREAAETIVRWIHAEYGNEHTNQDYRTALRSIGRYYLQRDEPPESLAWIPTGTSNDFDPMPSERDILTYDELQDMIDAAQNPRDAALFAVQFEGGFRAGELYDLRVGDVFDSEHSTGIHVDGKNGERTVHLITSVPYLQQWLEAHPAAESDQAWLWMKLTASERPSYTTFLNYFKDAASRAGIAKDTTPTALRKANTRWLAVLGWQQPRIEDRQGRKRGSDHTARYLAQFGAESNEKAYARLHGEDVEAEEPEDVGPIECPRCHRETPSGREFCMWCHFALSHEATEKLDETVDTAVDKMVAVDNQVGRQMYAEFVSFIRENPHRLPEDVQDALTSSASESSS